MAPICNFFVFNMVIFQKIMWCLKKQAKISTRETKRYNIVCKHKLLLLFRNCLQSYRYQCRNRNLPHVSILSVGHIAQIQKLCKAERSHFPNLIRVWRPHPEEGKLSKSQTFDPTKFYFIPLPVSNVRGLSFGWLLHLWSQR